MFGSLFGTGAAPVGQGKKTVNPGNGNSNGDNVTVNSYARTVQANIGEPLWVSCLSGVRPASTTASTDAYSTLWVLQEVASLSPDKQQVYVADDATKQVYQVNAVSTLPFDFSHIYYGASTLPEYFHSLNEKEDAKYGKEMVKWRDLTRLNYLHEGSLLHVLFQRYMNSEIYTWFGNTMISINPYEHIPEYYSLTNPLVNSDENMPHVFSVGTRVYNDLNSKRVSQSIVINGDSGAGKTEAAKQIMKKLVSLIASSDHEVEKLVLESTPVLEAFGNSITLRNDNSSRFGRFIQILYSADCNSITGMNTVHFLLEKSRLIRRSPGERNYHIFYQLCAASPTSPDLQFGFKEAREYDYLMPLLDKNNYTGVFPDDSAMFRKTQAALSNIGLGSDLQQQVWKLILGILSLGNVSFVTKPKDADKFNVGACEVSQTKRAKEALEVAAVCFGIENPAELEKVLIQRTFLVEHDGPGSTKKEDESTVIPLNVDQANDSRDALAKFLYGSIFDWVVDELNTKSVELQNNATKNKGRSKDKFIGILDIFGFEDLEHNSFEQVCVNYANELLQRNFDMYVIDSEKQTFKEEGVAFPDIILPSIKNSEIVLEILEKKVFSTLEEQCLLRNGNDVNFMSNLLSKSQSSAEKERLRKDWKNKNGFVLTHFAGEVSYDVLGFVDKNRDALTNDLKQIIISSASEFLLRLMKVDVGEKRNRQMAAKETVLKKFQQDMNNLLSTLKKTDQTFIRCLKPNRHQDAKDWDVNLILSQLSYLGITQAIRVHQDTYPIRVEFSFIANKYKLLLDANNVNYSGKSDLDVMKEVLYMVLGKESERKLWECGHTKVFLGNEVLYALDHAVNKQRERRLNAMNAEDRKKELEKEKEKQIMELELARRRMEKEKKEREQKEFEDMQKKLNDEIRLKEERMWQENERQMNILKEQEERQKREFDEKQAKLKVEEEKKKLEIEMQKKKLEEDEKQRLEKFALEKQNFENLSKESQQKLKEEELTIRNELAAQKQKQLDEAKAAEAKFAEAKLILEQEEKVQTDRLKAYEETLKAEREKQQKELLLQQQNLSAERDRIAQMELQKMKEIESKAEQERLLVLAEQKRVQDEQLKVEAMRRMHLEEFQRKEKEIELLRLQVEQQHLANQRKQEEEQEKLLAQKMKLEELKTNHSLKQKQEEERLQKEAEGYEQQKAADKAAKEKEIADQEELARKKEKKRNRKLKLRAITNMQRLARGMIIRSHYRELIARRKLFRTILTPQELVVFSSLIYNITPKSGSKNKKRILILTSEGRVILCHPITLKIEQEALYIPGKCRAVALSSNDEFQMFLMMYDQNKDPVQLDWKFKDLLNDGTTWVAMVDTLVNAQTYIELGFTKVLGKRVRRQNIIVPIKLGMLKNLSDDLGEPILASSAEKKRSLNRAGSRLSLRKSNSNGEAYLFMLAEQNKQYTLSWYENEQDHSYSGRIIVDKKMKVFIPDTSSFQGKLNIFVFCVRIKPKFKGMEPQLFTIQAKGKEDCRSWVDELNFAIKYCYAPKKLSAPISPSDDVGSFGHASIASGMGTIARTKKTKNMHVSGSAGLAAIGIDTSGDVMQSMTNKRKSTNIRASFNAAMFAQAFDSADIAAKQNIKSDAVNLNKKASDNSNKQNSRISKAFSKLEVMSNQSPTSKDSPA